MTAHLKARGNLYAVISINREHLHKDMANIYKPRCTFLDMTQAV